MKFFNLVNFTKEGKGVEKDEPQKRAFFRFWIRVWEKRYSLIGSNLLYLLSGILSGAIIAVVYYFALALFAALDGGEGSISMLLKGNGDTDLTRAVFMLLAFLVIYLTTVPVFAVGPFYSGFTFLLRSFVREQPVFLWTDFISKTRSNLKLSLKVCLTNAAIGSVLMIDAAAYMAISNNRSGNFGNVPPFLMFIVIAVLLFLSVLFLMVNLYIYPIVVTFNVSYKQLYKNAVILSLIRWIPNLLILILDAAIIALPILLIAGDFGFYVPIFLYVFITPAFIGFINNFYVNSTIQKYLIDNVAADKSMENN